MKGKSILIALLVVGLLVGVYFIFKGDGTAAANGSTDPTKQPPTRPDGGDPDKKGSVNANDLAYCVTVPDNFTAFDDSTLRLPVPAGLPRAEWDKTMGAYYATDEWWKKAKTFFYAINVKPSPQYLAFFGKETVEKFLTSPYAALLPQDLIKGSLRCKPN